MRNDQICSTAIDDILVSASLATICSSVCAYQIRDLGHWVLQTQLLLGAETADRYEVCKPPKHLKHHGKDHALWTRARGHDAQSLWDSFCTSMDDWFGNTTKCKRGRCFTTRMRESYKQQQSALAVHTAIASGDLSALDLLRKGFKQKALCNIADWKKAVSSTNNAPQLWTSKIASWLKKASPPMPYSILRGSTAEEGDCLILPSCL